MGNIRLKALVHLTALNLVLLLLRGAEPFRSVSVLLVYGALTAAYNNMSAVTLLLLFLSLIRSRDAKCTYFPIYCYDL